jgi:hypothetical protein
MLTRVSNVTRLPKHRLGGPSALDLEALFTEQWHVSRSFPGEDHTLERTCRCLKAPCGMAFPTAGVSCDQHLGQKPIRQYHRARDCKYLRIGVFRWFGRNDHG